MSSCGIRERMRPGEPWMTMSLPGCCFSFETSAAISPLIRCELFHSSFLSVLVATCLGMLLNRSANPSGSLRLGHAAAKPSYVTRPRRRASEEKVSSCLNFPISSFQYGNDHFSGDSTTPSNDMKRVAANRDNGSSHSREKIVYQSWYFRLGPPGAAFLYPDSVPKAEAAFVSGGPLGLDGQVAVLGLPGALVRQENRASGERPGAGEA